MVLTYVIFPVPLHIPFPCLVSCLFLYQEGPKVLAQCETTLTRGSVTAYSVHNEKLIARKLYGMRKGVDYGKQYERKGRSRRGRDAESLLHCHYLAWLSG